MVRKIICPVCKGHTKEKCFSCEGKKRTFNDLEIYEDCKWCHGTGESICSYCNGQGYVNVKY